MSGQTLAKQSLICLFALMLWACAPGYTASDVEQGIEDDADQIGAQFDKDARETGLMFKDAGDDVAAMFKGQDTTDRHELSGSNTPQNQMEHERQMAALCDAPQAEIHDLRQQGLSWTQIAKICRLDSNPSGQAVWLIWEN